MKTVFSILFVFFLTNFVFCQYYQCMNISNSPNNSSGSKVTNDSKDDFYVFWDEDSTIYYKFSTNWLWSETIPVFQNNAGLSSEFINSECINDTCYVFWSQKINNDLSQILHCKVYKEYISEVDSLYLSDQRISILKSTHRGNRVSIGWLENMQDESGNAIYVYDYKNSELFPVDTCRTGISIGYDSEYSLWVYWLTEASISFKHLINNEFWSEVKTIPDGMYMDIECKYNDYNNLFSLVLPGELYSGPTNNGLFYFEGYDTNWSERETIVPSVNNYPYWTWTTSSSPEIEITSQAECKVFFHDSYIAGDIGPYDTEEVCLYEKKSSDWVSNYTLPFDTAYFHSSAIDSKDSLYFTFGRFEDVYLAYKETPSVISKSKHSNYPFKYTIYNNYPNPFNSSTKIPFFISVPSNVTIEIYDVLGRQVAKLGGKNFDKGHTEMILNANASSGSDIPSGMYFYNVIIKNEFGRFYFRDKLLLIK